MLVAAVATMTVLGQAAWGVQGVTAQRLAGSDRYGTAASIAANTYGTGPVPTVVLASGENFPDALAAAYLAGGMHAPILLTPAASLSSTTLSEIQNLQAKGVEIVGGPAAVSNTVQAQLQNDGYTVQRIYGADRYATAQAIATVYPTSFIGELGTGGPTAIVASGLAFPDALAGSPLSYGAAFPTVLTDPSSLSAPAQSALQSDGIKQVLLLGGTAAVSQNVQNQIAAMGITVTRVAGQDRTDTAAQVASIEIQISGWTGATHVNLARGDNYPDALAGGPHAGTEKAPILLTEDPNTLGTYTTAWLQGHHTTISSIHVLGGSAAITDATVIAAQNAAT
ncbi:MAG TPA: cell wall-binding repeat-containing protein [Acidimicrobiales bacterium]|nr:cell wall-binding repeat-containing protein [Acidimicrobiales bacterium]